MKLRIFLILKARIRISEFSNDPALIKKRRERERERRLVAHEVVNIVRKQSCSFF